MESKMQDIIELEHVIGFGGVGTRTLNAIPSHNELVLVSMGCNLVVQNIKDDHAQTFLKGRHDALVCTAAVSPKGTFAASGQFGSRRLATPEAPIVVWVLQTGMEVYVLRGLRGAVRALAFSPDEQYLAASGSDGSVFVWDLQTGEKLANLSSSSVVMTLEWAPIRYVRGQSNARPEYTLVAASEIQVMAYVLKYSVGSMMYEIEKQPFRIPPGTRREYNDSVLSPDGSVMVLATSVSDLVLLDLESRSILSSMTVCGGGAKALGVSTRDIFVGGGDGTLKRLVNDGSRRGSWTVHGELMLDGPVNNVTVHASSSMVYAGTSNGTVFHIDGNRMRVIREVPSEISPLAMVCFKPSSSDHFATISTTGRIRVWDLEDYSVLMDTRTAVKNDPGTCIAFDDGAPPEVVAGYASGYIRGFDASIGSAKAGQMSWKIAPAHPHGVSALCVTRMYYASGGSKGGVRLWSKTSKVQLFEFVDHFSKPVTRLVPDCSQMHLLHSCSLDKSIYTYDLKKEKRIVQHSVTRDDGGFVGLTQYLHGDTELVSCSTDGRLLTWDFDIVDAIAEVSLQGVTNPSLGPGPLGFHDIQVSPKTGKFMAAISTDSCIRVWNTTTGQLAGMAQPSVFAEISSLAWSPDERQIVAVGQDMCLYIWNFFGS